MKNCCCLIVCLFLSFFSFSQDNVATKKITNNITKFNFNFNDEYSWLENTETEEVKNWVNLQNEFSETIYKSVKKKVSTLNKLKIYNSLTTGQVPISTNGLKFYLATIDPKKSPHLFLQRDSNSQFEDVFNPNKIYSDKNVSVDEISMSTNSKFVSCALRINGSDKLEVRFVDLSKNKTMNDGLVNVKFSNISWKKDEGVFYKLNTNKFHFEKDSTYKVFYHKLNTNQKADELIFDGSSKNTDITFFNNKTMFFLTEYNPATNLKKYYYADLNLDTFELKQFYEDASNSFEFINYHNGRIFYSTKKSNWGEIRSFNFENIKDDEKLIPQFYNNLLQKTNFTEKYLICEYKSETKTYLSVYDYEGNFIKKIESPIGANITFRDFDEAKNELYFDVESYTNPTKNFKIKITETKATIRNPNEEVMYSADKFEIKCVNFKNRDNIDVPIKIIHKKNFLFNGNNPCLLKAYGGFGITNSANYDNSLLNFLDNGGVYAFAEIRGGGEKGVDWHMKGSGKNKINGLNDFIDASEFLIKQKYTNPSKLAITGGSHGGLVVGYALTERPDLYKLAMPEVGVFDMINAHKYTVGKYHLDEFGNPNLEDEFNLITKYSPLNKIKNNVNYPTTIIFTADNDDRVPPFHSYKFAAALQNRDSQKNPILLITKKNLGHNGGNSYDKSVQEDAKFYDFLIYYLMK
ncbi:prolyl oligopeptidase family serine peptidase [Flavobacterium sp.]|uniref:prolyl oligopeptidase family serine peptidase n=1 Tax=Flavobacterium sp. TaxID=239 RepID=UPI00286E5605|nr:prolyl oligopeptidase family serine peptidase [Flavobacterium sp.]